MAFGDYNPLAPGDLRTNVGLRKALERRIKGMASTRANWEPLWQEIARFCAPRTSRYLNAYTAGSANGLYNVQIKQDATNSKLLDARAIWASEVLGNGMFSGLSSPARPWFKTKTEDQDLREFQAVKEWCDVVERRIYGLLARTNFYTSLKSNYRELGTFGIGAGFMESHWQLGAVVHPLTVGEYWVGIGDGLVSDSLFRRIDMTVLQHYQRFLKGRHPSDVFPIKLIEEYDRGNYDTPYPVFHAVEPNNLRDPNSFGARGKKFRSVYWSALCEDADKADERKALLAVEGYNSKPFWTPRWDVSGSDTYSTYCPGSNALADVRQLQLEKLRGQQAIDFSVKPALVGPATLNNVHLALQPGRVTAMAGLDKDKFGAIWEIQPQALQHIAASTAETREAVDRGFYADLFNAITNMRGVQPRNVEEIASRNEEKLTQLGPVVERVNQEMLEIAIDRAFDILLTAGALPPPPEELRDQTIEIEFISVLAQAQRMIGLGGIERTAGFISSISGAYPEAVDKFDADQAIDEYADIVGLPAAIIPSDDQVAAKRATRAQQQQAAQMAEQAAQLAPAVKAGAEAASVLLDSPGVGSNPSLADRLLGTG